MFCKNLSKIVKIASPPNGSKREFSQEISRTTGALALQEIAIGQKNDEAVRGCYGADKFIYHLLGPYMSVTTRTASDRSISGKKSHNQILEHVSGTNWPSF